MVEYRSGQVDYVFRALAHPVRRQILRRIARKEHTVSQLAEPFKMSLEAVSKHVQVLERAGLLRRTRRGRTHRCRLTPAPIQRAVTVLAQLARLWEKRMDTLEDLLRELKDKE